MKLTMTRRGFLAALGATAVSTLTLGQQAWAKAKTKLKLVSEKENTAAMLKYKHDASKSARKDKSQNCGNCIHYTKKGMIGKKEVGKCNLITAGEVAAAGWCASWVKKPG